MADYNERGGPEFWGGPQASRPAPVNAAAGLIRAFRDRHDRSTFQAMRDNFIESAALRYDKYAQDFPEAGEAAQFLRDNPKAFHTMASQFGGPGGYRAFEERFREGAIHGRRGRLLDRLSADEFAGEGETPQSIFSRAREELHPEDKEGNKWLREQIQPWQDNRDALVERQVQHDLLRSGEGGSGYSGNRDEALLHATQRLTEGGHSNPAETARKLVDNLEEGEGRELDQELKRANLKKDPDELSSSEKRHDRQVTGSFDRLSAIMKKYGLGANAIRDALKKGSVSWLAAAAQQAAATGNAEPDTTVLGNVSGLPPDLAGTIYNLYQLAKNAAYGESDNEYSARLMHMLGGQGVPLPGRGGEHEVGEVYEVPNRGGGSRPMVWDGDGFVDHLTARDSGILKVQQN